MGKQPRGGQGDDLDDVLRLGERARSAVEHVEDGRAYQAGDEGGDHREQAREPRGPPRREQESHGQCQVERADVARGVHGHSGVIAEDEGGHGGDELDNPDDCQGDPERSIVTASLARLGADGGKYRRRQVRDCWGARHPRVAVHGGSFALESTARRAVTEVTVHRIRIGPEVLAVETGRDRVSRCIAVHTW